MNKAFKAFVAACGLIAALGAIEQSWRYGRLGEAFAGQSYPNCPSIDQLTLGDD